MAKTALQPLETDDELTKNLIDDYNNSLLKLESYENGHFGTITSTSEQISLLMRMKQHILALTKEITKMRSK